MKRTYIVALIMGLFVTACNDADVIAPNGVEVEHTDAFIPEVLRRANCSSSLYPR